MLLLCCSAIMSAAANIGRVPWTVPASSGLRHRLRIEASALTAFRREAEERAGRPLGELRRTAPLVGRGPRRLLEPGLGFLRRVGERGERTLVDGDRMPGAAFFPDATLNFAENLLQKSGPADAIVFRGEDKLVRRLSWDELRAMVSQLQQALVEIGVKQGDRVAAMLPNMPEAIAGMLATASLGAIWSSCSPDFGVEGVLDRFGQIEPVVFIACDGYWYNGKQNDVSGKVKDIAARLPTLLPHPRRRLSAHRREGRLGHSGRRRLRPGHRWRSSRRTSRSSGCLSRIRSTSCSRRARPACRNASCIRPAARCSSTSRSIACMPASARATASSTSPPAAG